jgi:hypothetical protein
MEVQMNWYQTYENTGKYSYALQIQEHVYFNQNFFHSHEKEKYHLNRTQRIFKYIEVFFKYTEGFSNT